MIAATITPAERDARHLALDLAELEGQLAGVEMARRLAAGYRPHVDAWAARIVRTSAAWLFLPGNSFERAAQELASMPMCLDFMRCRGWHVDGRLKCQECLDTRAGWEGWWKT